MITEEEFLAAYDPSKYRHPSVAVDCVVFNGDKVLLIRRGNHPFMGKWALPGGFIEEGESAEQAVRRELIEETGLKPKMIRQFGFASTPGRDPRDWNISLIFTAISDLDPISGDDAAAAEYMKVELKDNVLILNESRITLKIALNECGDLDFDATEIVEDGIMAFDHAKILASALINKAKSQNIINNT